MNHVNCRACVHHLPQLPWLPAARPVQMALKCSDLGHTAASLAVHKKWLERLEEEFFMQGDK